MGYGPTSANPRVMDGKGRFKAWSVRSSRLLISFNPVIFFRYSVVVKKSCVTLKEVLKVKGADSDLLAFIYAKNKVGAWVLWVFV